MTQLAARLGFLFVVAFLVLTATTGQALAHTDEDAGNMHIFIEFGLWGLGLAGAIALLVLFVWVLARLRGRTEA